MLVVLFHLSRFELREAHWVGSGWRRAPWLGGGGAVGAAPFTQGFRLHCPRPWRWPNIDILVTVSRVCLPPVTSDVYVWGECREVQVSSDESWRLQNLGHAQKRVLFRPSATRKKWYRERLISSDRFPSTWVQGRVPRTRANRAQAGAVLSMNNVLYVLKVLCIESNSFTS